MSNIVIDAIDQYVLQCGDALAALKRLTEYVEDHGEVAPDDVNWGHVGQMAYLAGLLQHEVDRVDKKGEISGILPKRLSDPALAQKEK